MYVSIGMISVGSSWVKLIFKKHDLSILCKNGIEKER